MNDEDRVKLAILGGALVAILGATAVELIRNRIIYKREINQININKDLDLEAIKRTGDAIHKKIDNGEFQGIQTVAPLMKAFNERLAFEKIAVRFEKK